MSVAQAEPQTRRPRTSRSRRWLPAIANTVVALAAAFGSWHIWQTYLVDDGRGMRIASSDLLWVQVPDAPRELSVDVAFQVANPRRAEPSQITLTLDGRSRRTTRRPARVPRAATIAVSSGFADAAKCELRIGRSAPEPAQALAARTTRAANRTLKLLLGSTSVQHDAVTPKARLSHWLRELGPPRRFEVPARALARDGGARLSCAVDDAYLWSRHGTSYTLYTPRLISALDSTGHRSTLSLTSTTVVRTDESFYYERGWQRTRTSPYSAEANGRPGWEMGSGGAFFGSPYHEERSTGIDETVTVFRSLDAEQDRDIALLLLGVLLAVVVQYTASAISRLLSPPGTTDRALDM